MNLSEQKKYIIARAKELMKTAQDIDTSVSWQYRPDKDDTLEQAREKAGYVQREYESYPKVSIIVPGGQTFTLIHSKMSLKDFLDGMKSWPVSEGPKKTGARPASVKPTGARIKLEKDGCYQIPYKARPVKSFVDKKDKSHYLGLGVYSNAHFALKMALTREELAGIDIRELTQEFYDRLFDIPFGDLIRATLGREFYSPNFCNFPAVQACGGGYTGFFDAEYIDRFMDLYPGGEWYFRLGVAFSGRIPALYYAMDGVIFGVITGTYKDLDDLFAAFPGGDE